MFSDLNRFVVKTSKSLDILFDKRDPAGRRHPRMSSGCRSSREWLDKDAVSLPIRSPKLFSLAALYDANKELLEPLTRAATTRHTNELVYGRDRTTGPLSRRPSPNGEGQEWRPQTARTPPGKHLVARHWCCAPSEASARS